MKSGVLTVVCSLMLLCCCVSCWHNGDNGSIRLTLKESESYYRILAEYPERNTTQVEQYMSDKLGRQSNVSFVNTRIDAEITLDDGTKFYLDNRPGNLDLKLDKTKNSYAAYQKIKSFGEGLKSVLK